MKIKTKLSLLLMIFGIAILVPVLMFINVESNTLSITNKKENLYQTSKEFSEFLSTILEEKVNLALTLSSSPLIKSALLESNNYYKKLDKEDRINSIKDTNTKWMSSPNDSTDIIKKYTTNELALFFKEQQNIIKKMYGEIFITNEFGALTASTGKLTAFAHKHKYWWKKSYNKGKGKIFIDDRGYDKSVNGYVVGIVIPIFNNNEIIGILKANITIQELLSKLIINSKMLTSANMVVARSKGLIIAGKNIKPLTESIDNTIVNEFNKKSSGSIIFEENIVAYSKVPIKNSILEVSIGGKNQSVDQNNGNIDNEEWFIVVTYPTDKIINSENNLKHTLITMFIVLIISIVLISFLIANSISTPIKKIIEKTKKIGQGNLSLKINNNSSDEMGELIDSINLMTSDLNKVTASKIELQKEIKSKLEYENIINTSNLVSKTDIYGTIIYVNDAFCKITGYSKDELLGNNHRILKPDNLPSEHFKPLWDTISSKKIWRGIVHNITKDKNEIYLNTTISPVVDSDNNIIEYIATRFDITEEYSIKEKLIKLENNYRALFELSNLGLAIRDKDGKFLTINKKLLDMLGYEESYLLNKNCIDISINENIKEQTSLFRQLINKEITNYNVEKKYIRKDGTTFDAILTMASVLDDSGEIIVILSSIIDISELREKEKLLIQQSKMATMGEMLGSIAHQWKQPLSVISMSNALLKINQEDNGFSSKEELIQAIDDFRNFFNPNKERSLFKIADAFTETFKLTSSQFKNNNIEIIQSIENIELFCSQNELQQTLINLLKNAKEELLKKGTSQKRYIFINVYRDNEYVVIKVKDNAGGVPIDILPHVFEAYFTTKEDVGGSGIGLYMCKQIIEGSMRGKIEVKNENYIYSNENYSGAEFILKIPFDLRVQGEKR